MPVHFEISDFGFELQDSSDFRFFSCARCDFSNVQTPGRAKAGAYKGANSIFFPAASIALIVNERT